MAEQDFKYPVDLNKIKTNKLYGKFLKSLEKEPAQAKEAEPPKPIEYVTSYQNKPQLTQRATLVKPMHTHGTRTTGLNEDRPFLHHSQQEGGLNRPEGQGIKENSSLNVHLSNQPSLQDIMPKNVMPQSVVQKERRRGGDFRVQFANREFVSFQSSESSKPTVHIPAAEQRPAIKPLPQVAPAVSQESELTVQEYKIKLQRLSQSFEQFKKNSIDENRQRKAQLISYQETIEIMKEKMYDVQSREDELILENQRLKQKINSETVLRTRFEEDNKELDYKVQELTDMLESREGALRKKADEATHWKSQADSLKAEMHNLKLSNERLSMSLSEYEEQQQFLKREKQNKDNLQVDMKEKVALLIRENARLKDQMHFLSMKLNDMENQNFLLRTDIKRENNLSQALSSHAQQSSQRYEQQQPKTQQLQQGREPRRRGEFNREREKANETRENQRTVGNTIPLNSNQMDPRKQQISNPDRLLNELSQQQRILEEQVEKLRDDKHMNGAKRKQKIEKERELEAIRNKIAELQGVPK